MEFFSSSESAVQKFNCIATTHYAAAYLTSTGKVITWGLASYGGFSHHESIFTITLQLLQLEVMILTNPVKMLFLMLSI